MNVQQLTQQLAWILSPAEFTWTPSPQQAVLARVGITPSAPDFFNLDAAAPFALIHPEASTDNDEHPADLVEEARWTVMLFAANASDQSGGAGVVGGNRMSLGSSIGRGVLEIEPLVQAQIFNELGLTARPRSVAAQAVGVSGKLAGLIADRALDVVATRIPKQPDFATAQALLAGTSTSQTGFWEFTDVSIMNGAVLTLSWRDGSNVLHNLSATAGTTFAIPDTSSAATNFYNWLLTQTTTGLTLIGPSFPHSNRVTVSVANSSALYAITLGATANKGITVQALLRQAAVSLATPPSRYDLVGVAWSRGASAVANTVNPATLSTLNFVASSAFQYIDSTHRRIFFTDVPTPGLYVYTVWLAYDVTIDPATGYGVTPVAANQYSSFATSQGGILYLPATVTVSA